MRRSVSLCEIVGEFFKLSYWKASKSFAKRLNSIYRALCDYENDSWLNIWRWRYTFEMISHFLMGLSHFLGYVTLSRVYQTFKGMSHFLGYVSLLRVCLTFKDMSHFQGYVTYSRVCETIIGMSHFRGYVTFSRGRFTFKRVCIIFFRECYTF